MVEVDDEVVVLEVVLVLDVVVETIAQEYVQPVNFSSLQPLVLSHRLYFPAHDPLEYTLMSLYWLLQKVLFSIIMPCE